jgi:alanine dehydrogenase
MRVGVPKEIKQSEFRVGLTPSSTQELVAQGHDVLVEAGAGAGSGLADAEYEAAGARIAATAGEVFAASDLIVKVKEPQPSERGLLRKGQTLFTYLHLAPDLQQTRDLMASGATCIAYETVTSPQGGLPLLTPMSEVAGRLATQIGANYLQKWAGGRGVLLGGVPGVPPAEVVVLGGGVAGTHAATIAIGMGANVTVVDRNPEALRRLDFRFGTQVRTIFSTRSAIEAVVRRADVLIGTVLVPGAQAPKLVTRDMVKPMSRKALYIIASRTCRAQSRAHPRSRSTTPRCLSCWRSPARVGARPCGPIRICGPV